MLRRINPNICFAVYRNSIDFYLPPDAEGIEFIRGDVKLPPEHRRQGQGYRDDIWKDHRDFLLKNRAGLRGQCQDPRAIYAWGYQHPYDRTSRYANRFFLDPRSGWKDYYAELCAAVVTRGNYDGVFCDNAGAHIEWLFSDVDDDLKIDMTDADRARAMSALLTGVAARIKRDRPGAVAFANTCGDFVRPDCDDIEPTTFWRYAEIDGAMDELFAHCIVSGSKQPYVSEARWRLQVRSILCCEKMRRCYFALAQGNERDYAARIFSLGSFLIGAGAKSLFNYNPAGFGTYPQVYRLPEWDIDLGRPAEQYESLGQALAAGGGKLYARQFQRGLVLVNPTDAAVDGVSVPPGAKRLLLQGGSVHCDGRVGYEAVSETLTLPPHGAEILTV